MSAPPKRKKVTLWLPVDLHQALREEAVKRHLDLGELVEEAFHSRVLAVFSTSQSAATEAQEASPAPAVGP